MYMVYILDVWCVFIHKFNTHMHRVVSLWFLVSVQHTCYVLCMYMVYILDVWYMFIHMFDTHMHRVLRIWFLVCVLHTCYVSYMGCTSFISDIDLYMYFTPTCTDCDRYRFMYVFYTHVHRVLSLWFLHVCCIDVVCYIYATRTQFVMYVCACILVMSLWFLVCVLRRCDVWRIMSTYFICDIDLYMYFTTTCTECGASDF